MTKRGPQPLDRGGHIRNVQSGGDVCASAIDVPPGETSQVARGVTGAALASDCIFLHHIFDKTNLSVSVYRDDQKMAPQPMEEVAALERFNIQLFLTIISGL